MVDGALAEEGREAQNVQVFRAGADLAAEFSLKVKLAGFLTVPAAEVELEELVDVSGLKEELEFRRLQCDVDSLVQGNQEEVSRLEQ